MFSRSKTINGFIMAVILTAAFIGGAHAGPAAPEPREDRLISLYVYNFLLFVDWPSSPSIDSRTIKIGVFGCGKTSDFLDQLKDRTIRRKRLLITHVRRVEDLDASYHVLFVRRGSKSNAPAALEKLKGKGCLTMSDIPAFTDMGGMVALMIPDGKAGESNVRGHSRTTKRFRINLDSVNEAGLKIRSRLLRLSEIVGDVPGGSLMRE